jgi:hypothetical protein
MSQWVHLTSPVCATTDGKTMHAVKTTQKRTKGRKTYDSACGKRSKLLAVPTTTGGTLTVVWPMYVDQAREWGYERCRDCMQFVPGRPVRVELVTP